MGEKEWEGEGRPPFQLLLLTPPAHLIPGASLHSSSHNQRTHPSRGLLGLLGLLHES